MTIARGTFEVKVVPQAADDSAGGPFGRLFIDKRFHGDLDGTSKGQMLASGVPNSGDAGYVALEQVTGTLNGRRGSFVLLHQGMISKGIATLQVTVVPGSGTAELAGIAGKMTILIEGSRHSYEFDYMIPEG